MLCDFKVNWSKNVSVILASGGKLRFYISHSHKVTTAIETQKITVKITVTVTLYVLHIL